MEQLKASSRDESNIYLTLEAIKPDLWEVEKTLHRKIRWMDGWMVRLLEKR